jgi:transcriptional accessory protein Tex/SPT6
MYFFKDAESKIKNRTQYLDYQSIISRYYQKLMEFKYSTWKNEYLSFDSSNIYTEDYTVEDDGFVTNRRIDNWAYGDTRILEKILRNSLKINGYWISGYFAKSYF